MVITKDTHPFARWYNQKYNKRYNSSVVPDLKDFLIEANLVCPPKETCAYFGRWGSLILDFLPIGSPIYEMVLRDPLAPKDLKITAFDNLSSEQHYRLIDLDPEAVPEKNSE